jgi:hypothetical protein
LILNQGTKQHGGGATTAPYRTRSGVMAGLDKLIKKATDYAKKNPDKVKSIVDKVKKQADKRKGH